MTSVPPFDADRWRAISTYLDEALEMTPARRAVWLAGICARDPGLGTDLERLLAEHDDLQDSRFLERAVLLFQRSTEPE